MFINHVLAIAALSVVPAFAQEPPMPPAPMAPPEVFAIRPSGSFLGVGVREIDSERAKALKLSGEFGVEITKVDESSPAEKAGLKVGDVVLKFGDKEIKQFTDLPPLVRQRKPGDKVALQVKRGEKTLTVEVTLGSMGG